MLTAAFLDSRPQASKAENVVYLLLAQPICDSTALLFTSNACVMDKSKAPFIREYQLRQPTKYHHDYRPFSTRPWVLLLFLTATGVCFGLLVAVSLIDSQTSLNEKRDLDSHVWRRELDSRQATVTTTSQIVYSTATTSSQLSLTSQCYTYFSITETVYLGPTGISAVSTYIPPQTSYTGSCSAATMTVVVTQSLLSLTSQTTSMKSTVSALSSATTQDLLSLKPCWVTFTATETTYLSTVGSGVASSPKPTSSYLGTCSVTTVTVIKTESLLSLTQQATFVATSAAASVLSLTSQSTTTVPPPSTSSSVLLSLKTTSAQSDTPIDVSTAYSSAVLSLTSQPLSSISTNPAVSQISDGEAQLSLTVPSTSTPAYPPSPVAASSTAAATLITSPTLFTASDDSTAYNNIASPTASVSIIGDDSSAPTIVSSSAPLSLIAGTASNTPTTTSTASTTSTTTVSASSSSPTAKTSFNNSTNVDPVINEELVLLKITFHNYDYFLAVYLPKLIAVIMACFWSIIFASLKLMEPFYRLSAQSGAFGKDAMFGNYLSSELSVSSLSAMFGGQWVLILGSAAGLAWAAVVALISESMVIISKSMCTGDDGTQFRRDPGWAVNRPVLKILIGLLGLLLVLTAIVTWLVSRRKRSGTPGDPSSIAAMTELLGNPEVLQDLQDVDPLATDADVRRMLGDSRYKLGFYDVRTGKEVHHDAGEHHDVRYGLIKLFGGFEPKGLSKEGGAEYGTVPNPGTMAIQQSTINRKRRILQLMFDLVMLTTTLTIFGIVLGYYLDDKSDPLNDFFNSNTFGPRFVLSGLALILSFGWRQTSQQITLIAPYRNMARAFYAGTGAPAKRSILTTTACTPFTAFHKGLTLRNYMIAAVASSTVLSEVLLVAVSGVPFNSGQILPSLQASCFASLAILFIMALCSIAVISHNRTSAGGTRRLPRSPDTLAGVWLYLCGSSLVEYVRDGDEDSSMILSQKELERKYGSGLFAFTPSRGIDSKSRWTVDVAAELHSARSDTREQEGSHQSRVSSPRPSGRPYKSSRYSLQSQASELPPIQTPIQEPQTQLDPPVRQQWQDRRQRIPSPYADLPISGHYFVEAPERNPTPPPQPQRYEPTRPLKTPYNVLGNANARRDYRVVLPSQQSRTTEERQPLKDGRRIDVDERLLRSTDQQRFSRNEDMWRGVQEYRNAQRWQ